MSRAAFFALWCILVATCRQSRAGEKLLLTPSGGRVHHLQQVYTHGRSFSISQWTSWPDRTCWLYTGLLMAFNGLPGLTTAVVLRRLQVVSATTRRDRCELGVPPQQRRPLPIYITLIHRPASVYSALYCFVVWPSCGRSRRTLPAATTARARLRYIERRRQLSVKTVR